MEAARSHAHVARAPAPALHVHVPHDPRGLRGRAGALRPATATAADTSQLRLALPLLAGIAAAWVLWRFASDASPVPPRLVWAALPIYLGLWLATVVLHAWRWRLILRRLGADLPLARLTRLWLAARAIGAVVPSGNLAGEPVRVQLLAAHGLSTATATGAVALDRSIELAGNMIVGPLCIAGAIALGAGAGASMVVAACAALGGLVFFGLIYVRAAHGRPALIPVLRPILPLVPRRWRATVVDGAGRADEALRTTLAAHPGLVPAGIAVSIAIELLHLVELGALFAVFALAVPLPLLLLSEMGIGIAHAVPVTAALGALEATQIGLFAVGGEPLATGLGVAVALRLAETFWILVGLACLATAPGWRAERART